MTSANLTTNTKRERKPSLLGFSLKKYWTSILLFTIILFFVIPIPVMMIVSANLANSFSSIQSLKNDLAISWVEGIRYILVPLMSILAVVIPCARFGYLKNKVSIDFYHSLPIRREKLFFTQLGIGALALVIPYIFNVLFTIIYLSSNGLISGALIVNLGLLTLEIAVYALFFYSLSTLVGMVSGLTAVQLVLTVAAIFIVPGIQLSAAGFMYIFSENMWVDYYISGDILQNTSPALRFILNTIPLNLAESIIMIGLSAVMLGLALFLYRHRKSERAGQSVVFIPIGEVIKYIMMYIGTLTGGILFYAIMDDLFWTIFGMACGMVLTFMLTNTILHKTATAMFRGLRGLAIFGGAAILTLILLMTNAFGINSHVPSPNSTSKVLVKFASDSFSLEFQDRENIKALHKIYTESDWGYNEYLSSVISRSERFRLQIVFYNSLGLPTAKRVSISNKSKFIEEFRTILNSEEFSEQYSHYLDSITSAGSRFISIRTMEYYVNEYGRVWRNDMMFRSIGQPDSIEYVISDLVKSEKNCNFDYFQNPSLGSLYIYPSASNGSTVRHNVYTPMDSLMYKYEGGNALDYDYKEQVRRLANTIDGITVIKVPSDIYETNYEITEDTVYVEYDRITEDTASIEYDVPAEDTAADSQEVVIKDKAQITELLLAAADLFYTSDLSPFTFVDTEYYIKYRVDVSEPLSYETYNMSEAELSAYINENYDGNRELLHEHGQFFALPLLLGRTPDFVADLFE